MSDQSPKGGTATGHRTSTISGKLAKPRLVAAMVIVALAIWFIIANSAHIRVHLWVFWVSARLWVVLLGTFLAGVAAGWLLVKRRTTKR
jgi:uncharacterized integral membrane protein